MSNENTQPVTLIGNVGTEPEMRFLATGKPVTTFQLAVHAGKNKEKENLTCWFRITTWAELAEKVNQTVKKGQRVIVGGQLPEKPRVWLDDKNKPVIDEKTKLPIVSYDLTAFSIKLLQREYSESELPEVAKSV